MTEVVVTIGPGQIGQAIARRVGIQNTIDHVRKASDGPAMCREFIH